MKFEKNPTGGEYDHCQCGEDGDNANLYLIKGTNKFMCTSCMDKYTDALETIREFEEGL